MTQTFAFSTTRQMPKALLITQAAADRISELLTGRENPAYGVKVGVRRRGCNGYSYIMNYANDENDYNKLDEVITDKNVRVIVDKAALMFLIGTEMDFVEDEIRSEFVFNNPNSKGECGCGESFTV